MKKIKEPVRLRRKKLANGNESLYLDIYHNGSRKYEFLKLYLVAETTKADREKNRSTLALANAIKAKRIVSIQNDEYGFGQKGDDVYFFDYYRSLCRKRFKCEESSTNWGNWYSCLVLLRAYEKNEKLRLKCVTKEWVQGFVDFLDVKARTWSNTNRKPNEKPLSKNTKITYFSKLRACLNQACRDKLIADNPCREVNKEKPEEGTRMYLTIDELRQLSQTECKNPLVKRMFLFSCLTGLRRSDIKNLKWRDVSQMGGFTRIIFTQKKTKGIEYLDITPQAVTMMGERGGDDEQIFKGIHTPSHINDIVAEWVKQAGIKKKITFHCARHTFATMMLDLGADIYTVSKLLGHRELSTTQIYAKVLDKNKQAAVGLIPDDII